LIEFRFSSFDFPLEGSSSIKVNVMKKAETFPSFKAFGCSIGAPHKPKKDDV
jgi:hypothetical protein